MTLIDYSAHFWGDKHIGYNVLYENMKKGEETLQELINFLKERINMEDDVLKCLGKNLNRANTYISNNGSFVDAWQLTKGTLELWTEIQTTLVKNLSELSKDASRYLEELTKIRKRTKDLDTLEAINLMQTTTTCLQKAKETYAQRCNEAIQLKNANKEWNTTSTKEYLKLRNKLNKAHEEYRQYMDKYTQIRDVYEERIIRAALSFQEHDKTHLTQMKRFFIQLAKYLEDGLNAHAQIGANYRQNLENIDIEEIMLRFIDEKGTGTELPQKFAWTEADELPPELDILSGIQSQSSSNSSAIVASTVPPPQPTVQDLLSLDDAWISAGTNSFFGSSKSGRQVTSENCSRTGGIFDLKSGDSDSEKQSDIGNNSSIAGQSLNASSISNMPQQIWQLGRQKLGHWRLKKHSASQSSLPTTADGTEEPKNSAIEFSKSYGEHKGTNNFMKRYQKREAKNFIGDLTKNKPHRTTSQLNFDGIKIHDPLLEFGPPPPLPPIGPTPLDDKSAQFNPNEGPSKSQKQMNQSNFTGTATDSSTSDDEDVSAELQTSKIRHLQIKPLNESQQSKLNVSLDELRSAIGQISLQKSSTFENDPWSSSSDANSSGFSQSQGPIRPALTGDAHFHRKLIGDFDKFSSSPHDFSQSSSVFSTAGSIARARPRSHTPLTLGSNPTSFPKQTSPIVANFLPDPINSPSMNVNNQDRVVPVAMAINEFLHAWFKRDPVEKPEIRVFGTILLSLPTSAFPLLQNATDIVPLKFTVQKASQFKSTIPNQFFALSTCGNFYDDDSCQFSIEPEKLCKFLQEQRERSPQASFHNADLIRYEFSDFPAVQQQILPLTLKSTWAKLSDVQTEICIDYNLLDGSFTKMLLRNVSFVTKVGEPDEKLSMIHSEPFAKLDKGNLSWEFAELTTGDSSPARTLRVVLDHNFAKDLKPTNTYVQFQIDDISISGAGIQLDPSNGKYALSVFRKKVISGKYFCEPIESNVVPKEG